MTWNLQKKTTSLQQQVLGELVQENEVDVVVLQEAYGVAVATKLNQFGYHEVDYPLKASPSGVRIFIKSLTIKQFDVRMSNDPFKKLVFVELRQQHGGERFNVAAVHLHSKYGNTERQQQWKNYELLRKLDQWEKEFTSTRTIMVGDLNANPYEANLRDPYLLRGQEDRALIRLLQQQQLASRKPAGLDFWYNPTWNLLGDFASFPLPGASGSARPTGTFFRYTEDETPMWNLLDGFLVRPSLMDQVLHEKSAILSYTKSTNFLKPVSIGRGDSLIKETLPDHLPLKFALTIN
jgi:endonuclease/exonuclease/phosphatase family metal-dependent hydrolase